MEKTAVPQESNEDLRQKTTQLYMNLRKSWEELGTNVLGITDVDRKQPSIQLSTFAIYNGIAQILAKHQNEFNRQNKNESPTYAPVFSWLAQAFEHNLGRTSKQNKNLQKHVDSFEYFTTDTLKHVIHEKIAETPDPERELLLESFLKRMQKGEFDQFLRILDRTKQINKRQALYCFPHLPVVLLSFIEHIETGSKERLQEIYYSLMQKIIDSYQVNDTLIHSKYSDKDVFLDANSLKKFRRDDPLPSQKECLSYTEHEEIRVFINNISNYVGECWKHQFREKAFKSIKGQSSIPSMLEVLENFLVGHVTREKEKEKMTKELIHSGKAPDKALQLSHKKINSLVPDRRKKNKKLILANIQDESALKKSLRTFLEKYYTNDTLDLYMLRRCQYLKSFIINLYKKPPNIDPEIVDLIFVTALFGNKQLEPKVELISDLLNAQAILKNKDEKQQGESKIETKLTKKSSQLTIKTKIIKELIAFLNELLPSEVEDMLKFLSKMFSAVAPPDKKEEIEDIFGETLIFAKKDPLIQIIMSLTQKDTQVVLKTDATLKDSDIHEIDSEEKSGNIIWLFSDYIRDTFKKIFDREDAIEIDEVRQDISFKKIQKDCSLEAKKLRRGLKHMKVVSMYTHSEEANESQSIFSGADSQNMHKVLPMNQDYIKDLVPCLQLYFDELDPTEIRKIQVINDRGKKMYDQFVSVQIPFSYNQRFGFQTGDSARPDRFSLVLGLVNGDMGKKLAVIRLFQVIKKRTPGSIIIEGNWIEKGQKRKVSLTSVAESFKHQLLAWEVLKDELTENCSYPAFKKDAIQRILKAAQLRQKGLRGKLKK